MKATLTAHTKQRGFTLIELVMTIVILGIISAVTLPKFFNQNTFDERFFADDLYSAARYAQRLATGSGCAVQFSVSSAGFELLQDNNCDLSASSFTIIVNRPGDSEAFNNSDVPSNVTVTSSESTYIFIPQGGAVDGAGVNVGNASISLAGSNALTRVINIDGVTGYAYSN